MSPQHLQLVDNNNVWVHEVISPQEHAVVDGFIASRFHDFQFQ